jgi:hypothetical protein
VVNYIQSYNFPVLIFCPNSLLTRDANSGKNMEPFQYDLDVPLAKIRQAVSLAGKERKVLFQTTIPEIMIQQQKDDPELQLPKIFIILMKAIELIDDGVRSEGIFRISPNHKEIQDVIECFEADIIDFGNLNPYLASGVLKKWFRELKEPLIPFDMYRSCLALGIQKVDDAEQYDYIVSQLHPTNRSMLKCLVNLARMIESKKIDTKMNFGNLAIVLGPSILRNSDRTPAVLLQNAQFECSFVEKLLQVIDTNDAALPSLPLLKEFEDRKLLEDLSPSSKTPRTPSKYLSMSKGTRPKTQRSKTARNPAHLKSLFDVAVSPIPNVEPAPQIISDDVEMFVPVPYPWIQCFDEEGYIYYFNPETEVSQWEYPSAE